MDSSSLSLDALPEMRGVRHAVRALHGDVRQLSPARASSSRPPWLARFQESTDAELSSLMSKETGGVAAVESPCIWETWLGQARVSVIGDPAGGSHPKKHLEQRRKLNVAEMW